MRGGHHSFIFFGGGGDGVPSTPAGFTLRKAWLAEGLSKSKADWQVALTHFPCGHEASFYVAQLQTHATVKLALSTHGGGRRFANLKSKSMDSTEFQFSETNKNNELDCHRLLQHFCNRTWNEWFEPLISIDLDPFLDSHSSLRLACTNSALAHLEISWEKSDANRVWSLQTWIQWLRRLNASRHLCSLNQYPDLYPAVLWSAGKIWSVEHLPQKGDWNVMTSFGGTAWTSWSLDIDMIRSFGVPAGRAFFGFVGFFSLILCVFVSQVLASLGCLFILCLFNILPLFFVFGQLSQKSDSNYWWVFSGLEVWLALSLVAVVAFPQRLHQIFTTKGLLGKNRSVVRLVLVKLNIL